MRTIAQNSAFSLVIKRIIFSSGIAATLVVLSFEAATGRALPVEEPTIQEQKRKHHSGRSVKLSAPVDSIVVYKSQREMTVFCRQKKIKTYIISLGLQPLGKKRFKGDYKTPEGLYYINGRNPASTYHRNLGISYPNEQDRQYAGKQGYSAGGDIKIHGLPNMPRYKPEDYLWHDWTWGCIAVSNEEIEELYRFVPQGTPVNILP
jgi:murein L,D-transpeptidase YafK